MQKLKRLYRPIDTWEEIAHNMWGYVDDAKAALERAVTFTGDHKLYGSFMLRVVHEWPNSCENALTDNNLNKLAWIGQAACALALKCPEDITRKAWGHLTYEQRILANRAAKRALWEWEEHYRTSIGLRKDLGGPLLL